MQAWRVMIMDHGHLCWCICRGWLGLAKILLLQINPAHCVHTIIFFRCDQDGWLDDSGGQPERLEIADPHVKLATDSIGSAAVPAGHSESL